ncbi:MAG TPA: DUF1499 domain-containing protein, partial [Vicinamibacteria bacterium]|nr:DUF1499 domain-containing protein [Vicinamibacteria bacterium]
VALAALGDLLLAGPGSRMGWWTFRTGLLVMLKWAAYGGIASILLSVIALVLGGRRAVAAVALVVGLAALLPPFLFQRAAQSVPPIHDITTDTDDPPRFVAVLDQRAGAANPADYGGAEIAAQQRKAYPDLRSVTLADAPARVFERALAAARGQGWEIVAAVPADGRIEATDTTRWFGFKDDIVIRVKPEGAGSRLDVRSLSRVGKSDVGKNAARIRAYLSALGS